MYSSWCQVLPVAVVALLPALARGAAVVLPRAGPAPSVWVTVDNKGNARTVTPVVSGSSTVSAPPSYLTQTGTYTLTAGAQTTTVTGLPPVATPTGTGPEGAFLACADYQGPGSPFCQPRRGSPIVQGKSYYGELENRPAESARPKLT